MGPFAANGLTSLTVAAANDFGPGVTIITAYEITSRTGNQTISGTAGTTGGWQEQFSNTTQGLFFTGGTTMTYAEGAPAVGLNISANSHLAAGPVRGCRNGAAAVQRSAAPTYVAVTGTPRTDLGRHGGGTASACTATKILWQARLERDATDAELQSWTDTVNQLDRYRPPQSLVDAINAQNLISGSSWCWDAQTDYDPANSNSVTGIGTGPTWTRNGTPAKTTIEAEIEHVIQLSDWHNNVMDVATPAASGGPTYHRGNAFRWYEFTTNAARFTVNGICDWSGITGMNNLGVRQDGTPLAPLSFDRFSVFRRLDVLGLSGSHTYRIIDGAQSITGGVGNTKFNGTGVTAIVSVSVQAPKSATFTVVPWTRAANMQIRLGDSFDVGEFCTTSPTTEAAGILERDDAYPGDILFFSCGSFATFHFCKDSATITAAVAAIVAAAGSANTRIIHNLSPNDQGFHGTFWTGRAEYRTQNAAFLDAIHTALPSVLVHWRTPLLRTGAYEGSTVSDATPTAGTGAGTAVNGVILQDVRDDIATVATGRAWVIVRNGKATFPFFAPSANHGGDNFHPAAGVGHPTIKAEEKTYMAAAADSVGSGY